MREEARKFEYDHDMGMDVYTIELLLLTALAIIIAFLLIKIKLFRTAIIFGLVMFIALLFLAKSYYTSMTTYEQIFPEKVYKQPSSR